ncbi:MAG: hypothetical protein WA666_01540 [Nitrospirota bacterium]
MRYFDVVKEGFRTANRNLAVLLTQFMAGLIMLFVFFLLAVILVFIALGSIPKLGLQTLSVDNLSALLQTSFTLIAVGVFFAVLFALLVAFITAYVHSGNLGCLIQTARKEARGFTAKEFFTVGGRSVWAMLGLYIIWGLIALFTLFVFASIAAIGYEAVLSPLKEAGKGILAFTLGVPFILALILTGLLLMFFLYAGWAFSGIILVGERHGAFSSLQASYRFIKTHFWDALLFALLMFVLVFFANIISNVVTMPFNISKDTSPATAAGFLPLVLLGLILQMYVGLIARSCFVVYYTDRAALPSEPAMPPLSDTGIPVSPGPENAPENPAPDIEPPRENPPAS